MFNTPFFSRRDDNGRPPKKPWDEILNGFSPDAFAGHQKPGSDSSFHFQPIPTPKFPKPDPPPRVLKGRVSQGYYYDALSTQQRNRDFSNGQQAHRRQQDFSPLTPQGFSAPNHSTVHDYLSSHTPTPFLNPPQGSKASGQHNPFGNTLGPTLSSHGQNPPQRPRPAMDPPPRQHISNNPTPSRKPSPSRNPYPTMDSQTPPLGNTLANVQRVVKTPVSPSQATPTRHPAPSQKAPPPIPQGQSTPSLTPSEWQLILENTVHLLGPYLNPKTGMLDPERIQRSSHLLTDAQLHEVFATWRRGYIFARSEGERILLRQHLLEVKIALALLITGPHGLKTEDGYSVIGRQAYGTQEAFQKALEDVTQFYLTGEHLPPLPYPR